MIFWCVPLVIIYFMLGGQWNKLFRPIGVPISIIAVYLVLPNHQWWCMLPVLWYGFSLTIGYGIDSKLMKWLKNEQAVRITIGILNSIPIPLIILMTMNWFAIMWVPIIIANSCLRLGSWGKVGDFDILPVDILRGLTIGLAISFSLL